MHLCRSISVAVGISVLFCANSLAAGKSSAKDLFHEQLAKPSEKLNTGLTFWIELNRHGAIKRVNSTMAFKSGDKIRIHAIPNIDGYAYMIMAKGSTGKEAVLFPGPGEKQNNRVVHGKSYLIPSSGNLVFDNHPGKETLRLALSRLPVDAQSFLLLKDDGTRNEQVATSTAQQQQAPVQITQTPSQQPNVPPPKNYLVSVDDPNVPLDQELKQIDQQEQQPGYAKDLFVERSATPRGHKAVSVRKTGANRRIVRHPVASITVVNSLPSGQLFADIILNHQ